MRTFKRQRSFLPLLAVIVLAAACSTPAQMTYLKDLSTGDEFPASAAPDLIIKPQDQLIIQVSSEDPTLSAPFNTLLLADTDTRTASPGGRYVVDFAGNIDFPIFGEIPAEGKSIAQLRNEIKDLIVESGYIKEPIVTVTLDYFNVTLLKYGETQTIAVRDYNTNILQVVAPKTNEKIRDVMVIRTENGIRKVYSVNFQTKDIFDSPVFYLQQNDIIYVKPNGWKMSEMGSAFFNTLGTLVGLVNSFFLLRIYYGRE